MTGLRVVIIAFALLGLLAFAHIVEGCVFMWRDSRRRARHRQKTRQYKRGHK